MRERQAGDDSILLDFASSAQPGFTAARVAQALRDAAHTGRLAISDVVAGATTVLVQAPPGTGINELGVRRVVHDLLVEGASGTAGPDFEAEPFLIPTIYDGADLSAAAATAGCSADRLVRAHQAITWRVQFVGFAPGFAYLVPDEISDGFDVDLLSPLRRHAQSRPTVPTGSVAVAAGYSAVYPRESPGGWQLVGRTNVVLWDSAANPPAALSAGTLVRFTDAQDGR